MMVSSFWWFQFSQNLYIPLFYRIQIIKRLVKRNILVHSDSQWPTTTTGCESHTLKVNINS
ncbi:MAG: hypothetical protein MR421_00560 [Prevotella sp.]|nr:hypothetical protein [Prevotella sp.]